MAPMYQAAFMVAPAGTEAGGSQLDEDAFERYEELADSITPQRFEVEPTRQKIVPRSRQVWQ